MIESNGHLFLIGAGKFCEFDMYGTILNELDYANESITTLDCIPFGGRIYWIMKDELICQDLGGGNEKRVKLPLKQVLEFKKTGDTYYFRTADKILKYAFKNTH
jgi:hypothetical protein